MRSGNCCTNHGERSRIYPARHTRSTFFSFRADTTSVSCCSRALPFDGMMRASRPRCRADSIPGASARFEITTAISAVIRPAATESAIASKFDPRPDSKIPSFFFISLHYSTRQAKFIARSLYDGRPLSRSNSPQSVDVAVGTPKINDVTDHNWRRQHRPYREHLVHADDHLVVERIAVGVVVIGCTIGIGEF